jgi:hypothetical protein
MMGIGEQRRKDGIDKNGQIGVGQNGFGFGFGELNSNPRVR